MSRLAIDAGVAERYSLEREVRQIKTTRSLRKNNMIRNTATPEIFVDPQTFEVRADDRLLMCDPVEEVPLFRRYMLR